MHADDELFIPVLAGRGLAGILRHEIREKHRQCIAPRSKDKRVLVAEIAIQRRRCQAGGLGDAADGRRGDAVGNEQRLRHTNDPLDVLFALLAAFHGCTSRVNTAYSMPCFPAVCN